LIQSLQDKPALFIFGGILMLAYGIISFWIYEKKINTIEIDKEIIKNYLESFIKGFLLNVINIGVLGLDGSHYICWT
jgi:hypothetical protein